MKITPISKAFFGVPETDKDFDLGSAVEVYKWYMATPEAEQIMVQVLAEQTPLMERYHGEEIRKALKKQYESRKEILKRAIVNGAISKSMSDDTVQKISEAVDLIEKAAGDYTIWDRQDNARKQWRDKGGRFRQMGTLNIEPPLQGQKPVSNDILDSRTPGGHRPSETKGFNGDTAMRYQNAFAQISAALEQNPYGDILAVQTWENADGTTEVKRTIGSAPQDMISPRDFKGSTLKTTDFYAIDDAAGNPDVFDTMRAAGASRRFADEAQYQTGSGALAVDNVRSFNTNWETASQWDESGATRGMKRLGAASEFADKVFGNTDDPRVKAAIAAGKWAGQYGPEAEKVIGPHARKSAYRYRGVERKADTRLNNAYKSAIATATTPTDARTRIIYPRVMEQVAGRGQNARSVGIPVESPVINYFRSILPKEELLRLHTNSGAIAPSQGMIIDRKGAIATQAVGYGDDHYLPFNLKNLKALKGGEYIRTRTLGGPTTEDVYTGMVSGARAFTVVSHSGVYTVEFADDFRGGRRFNDKSARMVKRYGMLLDSLEAEQVTLSPVPKDRQDELMLKAKGKFPGDDEGSRKSRFDYFDRLRKEEQQDPKPSAMQKEEWAEEYLDEQAARYDDGKGTELTWKDVRGQALARAAAEGGQDPDMLARQFSTPSSTIVAIGMGEEYAKFLKKKESEYVATQKPLRLNGEGYYKALQALQEQFPYYISDVEYRPWEKTSNQKDQGYVKPRFNRPANIKAGYWDTSIEGKVGMKVTDAKTGEKKSTGKVSADETNYQNWTARQAVRTKDSEDKKDDTKPGSPTAPGGPGATPGGPISPLEKGNNRAELGALMKARDLQVKFQGSWRVATEQDRAGLAQEYPNLMGVSPEEIRRRYVDDDQFRKDVDAEAKKAIADTDRIKLPTDFVRNFDSTGVLPTKSFSPDSALSDDKSWFTFGDESDATIGDNKEITTSDLETFVENNDDLYAASESVGLNGLADSSGMGKITAGISDLSKKVVQLEQANRTGEFGTGSYTFIDGSGQAHSTYEEAKTALNRDITNLAKLRQAKRRYDILAKRSTGGTTYKVMGFTDPNVGPNGTLPEPKGPNGTLVDPLVDPTAAAGDKYRMGTTERKKFDEMFGKRMAKGYYSLRRI